MTIPRALIDSLKGLPGFDEAAFLAVHADPRPPVSIRINPEKIANPQIVQTSLAATFQDGHSPDLYPVPWIRYGYYLSRRPYFTVDPLLHAGAYYVQEASSMFLEQMVRELYPDHQERALLVLDLCAAPGGKSTHLASLFPRGLVLANETIKSRTPVLMENAVKWGTPNLAVSSRDPRDFKKLQGLFDLILVDAPCSGSGLFRKDARAVDEWSATLVEQCALRQQRILSDIWPALKLGGHLLYSTCSYSREENESIVEWIAGTMEADAIELKTLLNEGIIKTGNEQGMPAYRFYPYRVDGEGFFISCLRKKEGEEGNSLDEKPFPSYPGKEAKIYLDNPELYETVLIKDECIAIPKNWSPTLALLHEQLNLKKIGIPMGRIIRQDLLPSHSLALCPHLCTSISSIELNRESALQYLRKNPFKLEGPLGWMLVKYEGLGLGWIKNLKGRFNNYYPADWRIIRG